MRWPPSPIFNACSSRWQAFHRSCSDHDRICHLFRLSKDFFGQLQPLRRALKCPRLDFQTAPQSFQCAVHGPGKGSTAPSGKQGGQGSTNGGRGTNAGEGAVAERPAVTEDNSNGQVLQTTSAHMAGKPRRGNPSWCLERRLLADLHPLHLQQLCRVPQQERRNTIAWLTHGGRMPAWVPTCWLCMNSLGTPCNHLCHQPQSVKCSSSPPESWFRTCSGMRRGHLRDDGRAPMNSCVKNP